MSGVGMFWSMSREELAEKLRMKRRRMIVSEGDDITLSINITSADRDASHTYAQPPPPMTPSASNPTILTTTEHDRDLPNGQANEQDQKTSHAQDHDMNDDTPDPMEHELQAYEQPIQFEPADLSLANDNTEIRKARSANNILSSRMANANVDTKTNANVNGTSKTSTRKQPLQPSPPQQPKLQQIMLVTSSAASTSCEVGSEGERQEFDVVQTHAVHKMRKARSEFLLLDVSQDMEPDHDGEDPVLHYAYNIQRSTGAKDIEVVDMLLTHVQLERSAARAKTSAVDESF